MYPSVKTAGRRVLLLDRLKKEGKIQAGRAVYPVVYFDEADSTNRIARELARNGAAHGTLVIANTQTAGRGRRGRSWISPAGEGLFMTLILRPKGEAAGAAKLSLCCALAVCRAIRDVSGLDARIKWPNDIVAGGRKVCGMLLEMDFMEGGALAVSAGVGINVHQTRFNEEIAHTASSLDILCGRRLDRYKVAAAFLEEMSAAVSLLEEDDDAFMRAYCALSATIGSRVQVIAQDGAYTGLAEGVTGSGSLLVRADEDGHVHEVLAADVSVRGIMGYV